ncbi:YcgN family cysteine cluster protein [Methylobacter sp. S3L5C]|uniref:YcgN family cysteine cluster protein n=1 Tax=Methylobacter sp. S3L5C TaxID=2839024 RepID=UPI001FAE21F8|nr:YcgN family cysteine cluster protein [Methylobacter sp. S3L5C]UOA09111.1 YcgN family cysteine cluster protein [Methylobacter sp. S3L5C]
MSFWKTKKLPEMTNEEWESLCDNCGKCCLHKLEDEDTGEIVFTNVACKLINLKTCRCTRYSERTRLVPECLNLKQDDFTQFHWLPSTCAYRLLNDGKDLPKWHPLISGNAASVKKAGVSIRRYAIKESVGMDLEDHIIEWLD